MGRTTLTDLLGTYNETVREVSKTPFHPKQINARVINIKQKILFNLSAIAITLALVVSVFYSYMYWSAFHIASSPDCDELANSAIYCDPSRYTTQLIIWPVIALSLVVVAVIFTRMQINNRCLK